MLNDECGMMNEKGLLPSIHHSAFRIYHFSSLLFPSFVRKTCRRSFELARPLAEEDFRLDPKNFVVTE
jgi:hypothetical protein